VNKSVIGLDADKSLGQTLENDRCMSTAINETRQQVLGIDSEFCNVESFVTGVADNWPTVLRKHKKKFTLATVLVIFCLDIPHITQGGVYLFNLMDYYSASGMPMLFLVMFQTIAINWVFGGDRFCECVKQMTGYRPPFIFYYCWMFFGPLVMIGIFLFYVVQFTHVTYGSYEYPEWAKVIGVLISLSSMLWIPGYFVYYIATNWHLSFRHMLAKGTTPTMKPRTGAPPVPTYEPLTFSKDGLLKLLLLRPRRS